MRRGTIKNKYEIRGDLTVILINSPKYGEMEALISTNKLQRANEFSGTWCARYSENTKSFYALGLLPMANRCRKTVQLHRWITNAPSNLVCDHINHNTFDNTDENLRLVTNADNAQNRKGAAKNSSSGVRGVSWNKSSKKWRAQVRVNNKKFYLGSYATIEEAKKVVVDFRIKNMPFSIEKETP